MAYSAVQRGRQRQWHRRWPAAVKAKWNVPRKVATYESARTAVVVVVAAAIIVVSIAIAATLIAAHSCCIVANKILATFSCFAAKTGCHLG